MQSDHYLLFRLISFKANTNSNSGYTSLRKALQLVGWYVILHNIKPVCMKTDFL